MNLINQWDKVAEEYEKKQEISAYVRTNKEIIKKRFKNLNHQTVLDIGCDYGWYSFYFFSIGAEVIGCDGSKEMLRMAKSKYPNIQFDKVDLLNKLPYPDEQFDIVFCNQVLMDIDPFQPLIKEINRICKADGIFYMSIVHPAFYDADWKSDENGLKYAKVLDRYLSEYDFSQEIWGKTQHYHRTLSSYINTIIEAGFSLILLDEPSCYDGIEKTAEFPLFLFAEFKKVK